MYIFYNLQILAIKKPMETETNYKLMHYFGWNKLSMTNVSFWAVTAWLSILFVTALLFL